MHQAHEFLTALTIVLGVAAVSTIVFHRLRQPVVLGYLLAGLVIGPHVPIPLIASPEIVHSLSELGVILLMFGLGLEFRLRKLFRAIPTAGLVAVLQCSLMIWLGYVAARMLGWTPLESIFAGSMIAISSTTIIAKAFDDQGVRGSLRELVVAILIVEDLVAVLLMALLTGLSVGTGVSGSELATTVGRLFAFLAALVAGGLLVVPRLMRMVTRFGRAETTIVASIAVCFGVSVLARELGYSVALGAFVAGMLVAESGRARDVESVVLPIRDLFAAIFFVAVGMSLDPAMIATHGVAIAVMTVLVVVGKLVGVTLGAFAAGKDTRTSVAAGMSLAQIGEFSFIIASLGVTLDVVGPQVYPVAISVSAITTLLTPAMIRRSHAVASFVDRKLPHRLQTFVVLYASWIAHLRASRGELTRRRRFVRTVLLDVSVIAAVLITLSLSFRTLVAMLGDWLALSDKAARIVVVAIGGLALLPFCVSVLRTTHRFAQLAGEIAVPREDSAGELGRQPRVVAEAAIRLAGIAIAGTALVAITQPFLPGFTAAIVLLAALVMLAIAFWRTAGQLDGHVRAASRVLLEAIAAQSATVPQVRVAPDPLDEARRLLPGLGSPVRHDLPPSSPAVGQSLAELELRATTGATVLAILRDGSGSAIPDAHEPLRAGDVLVLAGEQSSVDAAIALLDGGRLP